MKNVFGLLILAVAFFSCGSNSSSTTNNNNNSNTTSSGVNISFKLNGSPWAAAGYGQYTEVDGKKIINVNGTNSDNGMDQFGIKIHNFTGTGTYSPVSGNTGEGFILTFSSMNSSTGTTTFYQISDANATVNVTAYDASSRKVSGTFAFNLKDQDGNITELTDGQFDDIELIIVN